MKSRIPIVLLLLTFPAFAALNGERQGFLVGFGAGTGVELDQTQTALEGNSSVGHLQSCFALTTVAKIGYGFNSRSVLFLSDHTLWKKPGETIITLNSVLLEYNYYFKKFTPALYASITCGCAWWQYPFDSYFNESYSGKGFSGGIGCGYVFTKHYSIEFVVSESLPGYSSIIPTTVITSTGTMNTVGGETFSERYFVTLFKIACCYLL